MKLFYLFFLLLAISSCEQKSSWKKVDINNDLKLDINIKDLFSQREAKDYSLFEEDLDTLWGKSSGIKYVKYSDNHTSKFELRSKASILNDTLFIYLGTSNGFSSEGFTILYQNNAFCIKESGETDIVIANAPKPKQKIIYQKLILDKENYVIGDSLYGFVDFRIKKTFLKAKTEYVGKGYFRTKIINN